MAGFVLLSTMGPISIILTLLVLGELSRRLGAVLKTGNAYRWYYVAATLVFASLIIKMLSIGFATEDFQLDGGDTTFALAYSITLTTGVALGIVITWQYWGWLVYASDGKTLR